MFSQKYHEFLLKNTETHTIFRQELVSMLPITLLNPFPADAVLDMCASPGSKTLQIIEKLHTSPPLSAKSLCICCELDEKRACMLSHKTQPLLYPGLAIFQEDASKLPFSSQFHKVLCDVPCSGDGTTRKNGLILKNWSQKFALRLHKTQRDLLRNGLRMLKVGGFLLYSTCSLNVIENEAVVSAILCDDFLRKHVELLDIETHWPEKLAKPCWKPGLRNWKVFTRIKKHAVWLEKFEEIPKECRSGLEKTMFSQENSQIQELLTRTRRIYPHLNDTGGFFLAFFKKTSDFADFSAEEEEKTAKPEDFVEKLNENSLKIEDFKPADAKILQNIKDFYTFSADFPEKLLFSASPSRFLKTLPKRLVFLNEGLREFWDISQENAKFSQLKTVSFGLNAFKFIREQGLTIKYRVLCESSQILLGFLKESSNRVVQIAGIEEFRKLMSVKTAKKLDEFSDFPSFSLIKALNQGPFLCVLQRNGEKFAIFKEFVPCLVFWKGISHINLLMKTQDLSSLSEFLSKNLEKI